MERKDKVNPYGELIQLQTVSVTGVDKKGALTLMKNQDKYNQNKPLEWIERVW